LRAERELEGIHQDENCALLGFYAASIGNSLPTFRDNIGPILKGQEDGTDKFPRNVDKELLLLCVTPQKNTVLICFDAEG